MPCRVPIEDLSKCIDNLLSAKEADVLKAHIRGCKRCQGHLKSFQKIDKIYGNIVRLEIPCTIDSAFKRKLQELIEQEER